MKYWHLFHLMSSYKCRILSIQPCVCVCVCVFGILVLKCVCMVRTVFAYIYLIICTLAIILRKNKEIDQKKRKNKEDVDDTLERRKPWSYQLHACLKYNLNWRLFLMHHSFLLIACLRVCILVWKQKERKWKTLKEIKYKITNINDATT